MHEPTEVDHEGEACVHGETRFVRGYLRSDSGHLAGPRVHRRTLDVVQRILIRGGNIDAFRVVDVGEFRIGEGPPHEGFYQLSDCIAGAVAGGKDGRDVTRDAVLTRQRPIGASRPR